MTSIRLLVIDDSATVRAIVEQVVEAEPDSRVVGVAANVEDARSLLHDLKPDLISLDLNMLGIGGLAFLKELSGQRHAPIVVLSSSTTAGFAVREQALSCGAEACFGSNLILAEADRFRKLLHKILMRCEREINRGRKALFYRIRNTPFQGQLANRRFARYAVVRPPRWRTPDLRGGLP